jgi:hypothetical protein
MRTLRAASEQFYTYAGERGGEYPHESGDSARDDAMLIDWVSSSVASFPARTRVASGLPVQRTLTAWSRGHTLK